MQRLTASIATALGALAIAVSASAAGGAGSELIDALPSDTAAVAVVRWSELRSAPLYRGVEERCLFRRGRADFDDFVRVTGIDPEHDVEEALVALRGGVGENQAQGGIALVRGRFDVADLTRRLVAAGAPLSRVDQDGVVLFRFSDEREGRDALAFPRPTLAVFGDEASVLEVCKGIRDGRGGLAKGSGLRAAFDDARHGGQLWGAVQSKSLLRDLLDGREKQPAPLRALATLDWVSYDADFGSDLRIVASGQASTADDAELVRQALDGFLAFAKLGAKEDAELLSALAEVTIERHGDRVSLSTTLPADLVMRHLGPHSSAGARSH